MEELIGVSSDIVKLYNALEKVGVKSLTSVT